MLEAGSLTTEGPKEATIIRLEDRFFSRPQWRDLVMLGEHTFHGFRLADVYVLWCPGSFRNGCQPHLYVRITQSPEGVRADYAFLPSPPLTVVMLLWHVAWLAAASTVWVPASLTATADRLSLAVVAVLPLAMCWLVVGGGWLMAKGDIPTLLQALRNAVHAEEPLA